MTSLSAIISNSQKSQVLTLLQSSVAQSALSILKTLLERDSDAGNHVILLSCLYPSRLLLPHSSDIRGVRSQVLDWTAYVPGYNELKFEDRLAQIESVLAKAQKGPITFVVDSLNTLNDDLGSDSATLKFITFLRESVSGVNQSRLICHSGKKSHIFQILSDVSFSPSLIVLSTYPISLLNYIAKVYLVKPPPSHNAERFWQIFMLMSKWQPDFDKWNNDKREEGVSRGEDLDNIVVEVLSRSTNSNDVHGIHNGMKRTLEGWSLSKGGPCPLVELPGLMDFWSMKSTVYESTFDPVRNVPFNIGMSSSQIESRSQVPLPYAHEGNIKNSTIIYEPDSADDLDEEDPDNDLDI